MSREASLQETINNGFAYHMQNIYTTLPGVVVTVRNNLEDMTIDVQPTLNIKNKDGSVQERPIVLNVPFQFPSSSTAAFTFPINVGDPVLLIFSMRGLDTWKRGTGRPVTPTDFRKFDKKDCFAIPGIHTISGSINNPSKRVWTHDTSDAVLVNNIGTGQETEVRLKASGDIIINTQQNVEVNCEVATINANSSIELNAPAMTVDVANTTWIGNINQVGNYTQTGTFTLGSVNMNLHTHPILSGSSAPGPTGGPQ